MPTKTLFQWEQDRAGGLNGIATFFSGTERECSLPFQRFEDAHALHLAIEQTMRHVRESARAGLIAEIGRIKP